MQLLLPWKWQIFSSHLNSEPACNPVFGAATLVNENNTLFGERYLHEKMSKRRKGREIALKILYQYEWQTVNDLASALKDFAEHFSPRPIPEDDPSLSFARYLLEGVLNKKETLDSLLKRFTTKWRLDRMASVDRNILRLGAYELCYCPDIPPKVAINEAVELAKNFGSEESSGFVNGILDAIYRAQKKEGGSQ